MTQADDRQTLIKGYIEAFEARDLDRCMSYFSDDAAIDFQDTIYSGRQNIESWHNERFEANLRIRKLESVRVDGDTAVVDVVISSDRLSAWNVKSLNGRITVRFEGEKFREGKLAARMTNVFDMLRSSE